MTVDRAWATLFPQYQPFLGEKLCIHMIGGGHQAMAVPESVFPRGGGILDNAERELRATAKLLQLYFEGEGFQGDLWLPYQDEAEYIDRQAMALDVRALCEAFQIAPAYDPLTQGGRYPDAARVVIMSDRDLKPMVADTLNNPAYGSGMGWLGTLNKLVYLSDSRELIRQERLVAEPSGIVCRNAAVEPDAYRRMQRSREGIPKDEPDPMPFSVDALCELCIESGYAMRSAVHAGTLEDLTADPPADEPEAEAAAREAAAVFAQAAPPEASPEGKNGTQEHGKPAKPPRPKKKVIGTIRGPIRCEQMDMFGSLEAET